MVEWLFFDLGSTLIDETDCAEYRLQALVEQSNAPSREVLEQNMMMLAKQNKLPYKDTAKQFGLETTKWPIHLEKVYNEVPNLLAELKKNYRLGVIANQSLGTEERMKQYGIHQFFDVIISSAEVGVSKPELRIFELALEKAGCRAEEAYMIGDRLDNDIEPAATLGMKTIWVKQGSFAYGDINLINHKPDFTVDRIEEIVNIL